MHNIQYDAPFEPAFIEALRQLVEEKITFNHVIGLKLTGVSANVLTGRIHMRRPIPGRGFHDEQLYIYDLELADNFVPTNHDGEVSGFIEISLSEAAARILADEFTSDAAFVTADFILRNIKVS